MAESVDVEKLRSFLTCSICLDHLDNPKRLTCSHLFCKCCLEDLVEFSQDGSATIQVRDIQYQRVKNLSIMASGKERCTFNGRSF